MHSISVLRRTIRFFEATDKAQRHRLPNRVLAGVGAGRDLRGRQPYVGERSGNLFGT